MEVRRLTKAFAAVVARFLSIPDPKRIHFIPDRSCVEEQYNLARFSSDNVLSVVQKITNDERRTDIKVSMVTWDNFDRTRASVEVVGIPSYIETKIWYFFLAWFRYYKAIYRSTVIVTSSPLEPIKLLFPAQIHIAANYYIPFKSDIKWKVEKSSISFVITTGELPAVIDSKVSAVPLNQYIPLGFARNDHLTRPRLSREEVLESLEMEPKQRILVYNPTHRAQIESSVDYKRHIKDLLRSSQLLDVLNEQNAVLVVKLHSDDVGISDIDGSHPSIKFYKPGVISYYDILPHAELMITDYSSIYFDFLLTNKPVIFYHFDYESYKASRGFSHSNLSEICAGPRCFSQTELLAEISSLLGGGADVWSSQRLDVANKIHFRRDGESSERLVRFILSLVGK